MAKVILHIGFPKTASTTLQNSFFPVLDKKKINFLGKTHTQRNNHLEGIDDKSFPPINHHLIWSKDFWDNFAGYQEQLSELLMEDKINVFSEEMLSPSNTTTKLRHVVAFPERLKRLKSLLSGHSVEVLCVLRRQPERVYSYYAEGYPNIYSHMPETNTPVKFYEKYIVRDENTETDLLNYEFILQSYRETFGGKIYCLFFEELSENSFSFYQKIASVLKLEVSSQDIPTRNYNVKKKNSRGYIVNSRCLIPRMHLGKVRLYKKSLFFLLIFKCWRALHRFVWKPLRRFSFLRLIRIKIKQRFKFGYDDKEVLLPYFTEEQKKGILERSRQFNQKLFRSGFCSEEELRKYGYL